MKHTPTPWAAGGRANREILAADGTLSVASVYRLCDVRQIVRAVNAHGALVAALHRIAYEPIGDAEASHADVLAECVEIARAALALAEEKSE